MCRILRWIGYASTLVGAVLIVMAIIGGCKFHHHFVHEHGMAYSNMQHPGCGMAVAKTDSGSMKHSMMVKQDSAKCCKNQAMCCAAAPAICQSCQMHHARISFNIGLAICFLLLAIVLIMISNSCRCKKCCESKEGKSEFKKEKKE